MSKYETYISDVHLSMWSVRGLYSSLNSPPLTESISDTRGRDTELFSPLPYWFFYIFIEQIDCVAFIPSLLNLGSPLTILGRIIAIIIYSFNAMFDARGWSHIGIKILERLQPPIANFYTTTTIVSKFFIGRVEAPFFHFPPRTVLLTIRKPMSGRWATVGTIVRSLTFVRAVYRPRFFIKRFTTVFAYRVRAGSFSKASTFQRAVFRVFISPKRHTEHSAAYPARLGCFHALRIPHYA